VHEITCPACHVVLPLKATTTSDSSGRSTTFDESFVDEHMAMHAACTCLWVEQQRHHDNDCTVHN
jgi:hypothetical protein